jgi:spore maturation protein CgeB
MKIGFYIKFPKFSLERPGNVLGEEIFANSLCRGLRKLKGIASAELYAPNHLPQEKLDVMIYMDTYPPATFAEKNFLYWQYSYDDNFDLAGLFKKYYSYNFDGYLFFSDYLLDMHKNAGINDGICLPFGVDCESFIPQIPENEYCHDVAYLGSYIKGKERTDKYLRPCTNFNFGLYGNWNPAYYRFRYWRNWPWLLPSRKRYMRLSHGKLAQEKVAVLYSSAKININFSIASANKWNVISFRTYEILACKGFLITDSNSKVKAELKGKVIFSTGGDDLRDKIKYYLEHETERLAIAQAGYEYALDNGSIFNRAEKLFRYISQ